MTNKYYEMASITKCPVEIMTPNNSMFMIRPELNIASKLIHHETFPRNEIRHFRPQYSTNKMSRWNNDFE